MFGFNTRSAANNATTQNPAQSSWSNPFDSDDESNTDKPTVNAKVTSSEPKLNAPSNPFDDDHAGSGTSTSVAPKNSYKNDFRNSGGLENQSVQELENYTMYKAKETTRSVENCLRIAEDIRQDAMKTLETLHAQGEQITRTHQMAAEMDKDLSKGEKLLSSLGGMFSRSWKPKKMREINGPLITADNPSKRNENHKLQRENLVSSKPAARSGPVAPLEPTNAMQRVELEKAKQEDALSDLSNILGDLKSMVVDMGGELDRQNKALDHFSDDVDELNSRVKGANGRVQRLLGK